MAGLGRGKRGAKSCRNLVKCTTTCSYALETHSGEHPSTPPPQAGRSRQVLAKETAMQRSTISTCSQEFAQYVSSQAFCPRNSNISCGGCLVAKLYPTLGDPMDIAHQAPLSRRFLPREECWSRLPFPSPGDLPDPETELHLLRLLPLAGRFFTTALTRVQI